MLLMTLMLASVSDPSEAEIALVEGADIIDLKDPSKGAFAAVDLFTIKTTLDSVAGRHRVSAVCGDLPMDPRILVEAATTLAAMGVDFVKLGFFPSDQTAACIAALRPVAAHTKLIAVCFTDIGADLAWLPLFGKAGFAGAMLDTAVKSKLRLILSRGHVALAETLAEQIADALLAHPRVIAVQVRVEKLDVVDGCVGVELTRERAAQTAATPRRLAPLSETIALKSGV